MRRWYAYLTNSGFYGLFLKHRREVWHAAPYLWVFSLFLVFTPMFWLFAPVGIAAIIVGALTETFVSDSEIAMLIALNGTVLFLFVLLWPITTRTFFTFFGDYFAILGIALGSKGMAQARLESAQKDYDNWYSQ